MEYIDENEEARSKAAEIFINNDLTGEHMDPQGEQDRYECELDGQVMHPDFEHLNPDFLNLQNEKQVGERQFKPIEVDDINILCEKTRKLDFHQRKVVEKGINYARCLVKSQVPKKPNTSINFYYCDWWSR